MNTDPRYPIGKFVRVETLSAAERAAAIDVIAELPRKLRATVHGLTEQQIDTPYREGGWTIRQTVHHVSDSHSQASGRMRKALTEEWPMVVPYKENLWAELVDSRTLPAEVSLQMLDSIHARWVVILRAMKDTDWSTRGYIHPENGRQSMEQAVALYAWHGRHHTAHIAGLRERMGW